MFLDRFLSFLTSLRLTVFCLACALVLVFAGTLAQVHLGLYVTQARYFHSLFVFWGPPDSNWKIPVWPGGYLLGAVLLVNLVAAHVKRFTLTPRKIGLFLIHSGLILLFLGQFLTETFQVESFMRLEEGETKNFTESARNNELVIIDTTSPDHDQIVAIPESRLAEKKLLQPPGLPFTVQVKDYFPNSAPAPAMRSVAGNGPRMEATQGVGQRLFFRPQPSTARTDDENVPAALVEIVTPTGPLGSWTVSNWLSRQFYAGQLRQQLGQMGTILDVPQQFTYQNRTYRLAFRPVRYYEPYSLTLEEFNHKRYKGTEIPKDFSSRIRLRNAQTGEDREVKIYMNNPLRYAGQTFYQGGFEPGDTVSILQVVRNPAWLTPYLSCTLVGVGLVVQFLIHLVKFGKKTVQAAPALAKGRNGKPVPQAEKLGPAAVALGAGSRVTTTPFEAVSRRRNS
jgi:ResB-like family